MNYSVEDCGAFKMIRIGGNIDTETSTKILDGEVSVLMRKGFHHYVFDLKGTTYLDSAGISIFIHCLCDVQENKGSIYIIAEESPVFRVLEMVGITRLIKTYTSEAEFRAEHVTAK
jgi:anti-anti-sigma factor